MHFHDMLQVNLVLPAPGSFLKQNAPGRTSFYRFICTVKHDKPTPTISSLYDCHKPYFSNLVVVHSLGTWHGHFYLSCLAGRKIHRFHLSSYGGRRVFISCM